MQPKTRRVFLLSSAAVGVAAWTGPAEALFLRSGVGYSSNLPKQLTTMTLVNTGGLQAAGFVTPIFGHTFKQGDVPTGTAPQFLVSGTVQPYSWGLQSYWPDGSLRHASFMFLCSVSIVANGTLSVGVYNGGVAPSASSRTLTEVYAQNLQVGGPGIGAFGFLTGTWNGYLTNDANNTEQFVYMDGQAGKVWRIKTHMAQTQGGTAHGQLEVYHYITALQDNSGNLGGFRHIARITQPYYNNDTPTKNLRTFSSVTTQYGSGPTSIPLTWPFNNINFTGTNGSGTYTVASSGTHNLYCGANTATGSPAYINAVPGYLSATTDPALSTTQIYYAYTLGAPSNTQFNLSEQVNGSGNIASQGGTSTFVPLPTCLHFGSIWTADSQAKSNFFQGTGSMVADGTIRTQYNLAYLHSTGAVPPWILSLAGTVKDIPAITTDAVGYWSNSPQWSPPSCGPTNLAGIGGTGDSPDIGPMTTWQCAHAFNQSAVGDLAVRAIGFTGDVTAQHSFRDYTTGQYPNVSNANYTGMPTKSTLQQSGIYYINGLSGGGFTVPANPSANSAPTLGHDDPTTTSHRPNWAYYAFLVFGEPHFYDEMIESATATFLTFFGSNKVTLNPAGYGIVTGPTSANLRANAWAFRDLMLGAAFGAKNPITGLSPDGSQLVQYLQDMRDANITYFMNFFTATYIGAYQASVGAFIKPVTNTATANTSLDDTCFGFQLDYWLNVMAWAAALGNSTCLTACNNLGNYYTNFISQYGNMYGTYAEDLHGVTFLLSGGNPYNIIFGGGIPAASLFGIPCQELINTNNPTTSIAWKSSSPCFSYATGLTRLGYAPTNGDAFIFDPGQAFPGGFTAETGYVLLNVAFTGGIYYFDLALASNPTVAITPTTFTTTIAATGSSYNSTTGLVTLNTNAAHGLTNGSLVWLNLVTGTGANLNELPTGSITQYFTCGSGTTGTTITFTIATGLIISSITGGNVSPITGFNASGQGGASGPWIMPAAPPAPSTGIIPTSTSGSTGTQAASSYLTWLLSGMNWATAAGATGFGNSATSTTPIGDAATRLATTSVSFVANANWSSQATL